MFNLVTIGLVITTIIVVSNGQYWGGVGANRGYGGSGAYGGQRAYGGVGAYGRGGALGGIGAYGGSANSLGHGLADGLGQVGYRGARQAPAGYGGVASYGPVGGYGRVGGFGAGVGGYGGQGSYGGGGAGAYGGGVGAYGGGAGAYGGSGQAGWGGQAYGAESYKPFQFGYNTVDEYGTQSGRQEVADGSGTVRGSYSYRDANGQYRQVNYVADPVNGFRAEVNTNEAGVIPHRPADAVYNVQ